MIFLEINEVYDPNKLGLYETWIAPDGKEVPMWLKKTIKERGERGWEFFYVLSYPSGILREYARKVARVFGYNYKPKPRVVRAWIPPKGWKPRDLAYRYLKPRDTEKRQK